MTFQLKDGQGAIFKNKKKEKETHPNMTGSANIGGVEYWISAWTKQGEKGAWQSLAFKRKDAKKEDKPDEDIPF